MGEEDEVSNLSFSLGRLDISVQRVAVGGHSTLNLSVAERRARAALRQLSRLAVGGRPGEQLAAVWALQRLELRAERKVTLRLLAEYHQVPGRASAAPAS